MIQVLVQAMIILRMRMVLDFDFGVRKKSYIFQDVLCI